MTALWTALVPIKAAGDRKTRLTQVLSPEAITALTDAMLRHVIAALREVPSVGSVCVLSPEPPSAWRELWTPDAGAPLNQAVTSFARRQPDRLLVIHADLPRLRAGDVEALIDSAGSGVALAPDHTGSGTNAIALHDARGVHFSFGPGSFARHVTTFAQSTVVRRPGCALDIDIPADLPRVPDRMLCSIAGAVKRTQSDRPHLLASLMASEGLALSWCSNARCPRGAGRALLARLRAMPHGDPRRSGPGFVPSSRVTQQSERRGRGSARAPLARIGHACRQPDCPCHNC